MSGSGNNGTITSGNWTTGKVGNALENFSVQVPHNPILNLNGPNSVVLLALIPNDYPDWVVYKRSTNGWLFRISGPIGFAYDFVNTAGSLKIHYWYPLPTSTDWYFLALTYDFSRVKLFKGTPNSWAGSVSISESDNISTSTANLIIINPTVGGKLDEVRLYNRALSDAEIKALYDATK